MNELPFLYEVRQNVHLCFSPYSRSSASVVTSIYEMDLIMVMVSLQLRLLSLIGQVCPLPEEYSLDGVTLLDKT